MTTQIRKVLVVDDDPYIFQLVQLYLKSDSTEVLQALDAYSGFDLARRQRPDLIILDVMMPGMGGLEMCRLLRETPSVASTPVVILSAKAKPEDISAGYQAGADEYVTKPFDLKNLARLVDTMMAERSEVRDERR